MRKNTERQDFVDNKIYQLVVRLNPTLKQPEWDIERIGNVRDAIIEYLMAHKCMKATTKFY